MKERTINLSRRNRLFQGVDEFKEKIISLSSVFELLLVGSLASDDEYPNDIDLTVFLDSVDDISSLAKYARQMSPISHNWDLFVFSHERKYIGRVCHRKSCPATSIECRTPQCGDIPHIKIIPDFDFDPRMFLSSPYKILFSRKEKSIFESWRVQLNITEIRTYEKLKPIRKTCIVCGRRFTFSVAEQKIFAKDDFSPPKRCDKCRMNKYSFLR